MADLFEYIKWRGDLTFEENEFCAPDALLLCMISYLELRQCAPSFPDKKKISIVDVSKKYYNVPHPSPQYSGIFLRDGLESSLNKTSETERFKKILISNYVSIHDIPLGMQFSATVFHLSDKVIFIAFRGTDTSLVGWKENFSMSYTKTIPAQKKALEYIISIANIFKGKIIVGGHSKGGNLAVYSSANAPNKIKNV